VATLEEILFRGGIFGGLRRMFIWPLALMASSMVYALVHFLQRTEWTGAVAWNSGLILLPRMLGGFADFYALVPGFFSLTLAGILLGLAYQRTGNLYFSIGLHAGWIFWLKAYGAFTASTHTPRPGFGARAKWWMAGSRCGCFCLRWPFSNSCPSDQRVNRLPFRDDRFRRIISKVAQCRPRLFLSRSLPALRSGTRDRQRRLRRRALPVAGALHPTAVLRTLRIAVRGRHHDAV
jgi:hypothetical protein